jgi:acid phosphatase class B
LTTSGCETLFGPKQLPPATIPLARPVANEVSIEQLKRLLPAHPIVVGFDVDDTLVFSAPAFNALQPAYPAEVIRPKDYAALTTAERRQYHEFWNLLNEQYDDRSIPKRIGKELLDLHLKRGDDIYIISRRQRAVPATNTVTRPAGAGVRRSSAASNCSDRSQGQDAIYREATYHLLLRRFG